jgi:DNA-binding beta-propeller fold protein YncE
MPGIRTRGGRKLVWLAAAAVPLLIGSPAGASAGGLAFGTSRPPGATIKVSGNPDGITADPKTGTVWAADWGGNNVPVISERLRKVVATISTIPSGSGPIGIAPVGAAADPVTGTVWVTAENTCNVLEIKEATRSIVRAIPVGSQNTVCPGEIAADPVTGTLWVTGEISTGVVWEISEKRAAVVAKIRVGHYANDIAVDSKTGTVWVADDSRARPAVSVIREASRSVIATIRVAPNPEGIGVDPTSGDVWVGSRIDNTVSEISEKLKKVVAVIRVHSEPLGLGVDPSTGTVWVTFPTSDKVSIISEGRHVVARTEGTGTTPGDVALDPRSHTVWIANFNSSTITTYQYSAPRFTTRSRASFTAGKRGRFIVRTQGFPVAVTSLSGRLPVGLHWSGRAGTVRITGVPARSDRRGDYRITIHADNGIGTAKDQYIFVQHLVIKVS